MVAVRPIAATIVFSALVLLGGCATTSSLTSSADRLERNAEALAQNSRGESGGYSRDARELADQAHDFRRTVNDRRADSGDVKEAFEALSKDYHALRDEVDRSNSREAALDLKPVTEAYLDIERGIGGYKSSDRYARDRDPADRY
jgi:phage shock protein A